MLGTESCMKVLVKSQYCAVFILIIELVDSISRDGPDMPYM